MDCEESPHDEFPDEVMRHDSYGKCEEVSNIQSGSTQKVDEKLEQKRIFKNAVNAVINESQGPSVKMEKKIIENNPNITMSYPKKSCQNKSGESKAKEKESCPCICIVREIFAG
jgi:hypothetical protein